MDDLVDTNLEKYISQTQAVLVFCTKAYFLSRNCMCELISSVAAGKQLIAVLEDSSRPEAIGKQEIEAALLAAHGSYAAWEIDETAPHGDALSARLFQHDAIEWNRLR